MKHRRMRKTNSREREDKYQNNDEGNEYKDEMRRL
jgi:hypothetical protein